jgi:hypothetical protein
MAVSWPQLGRTAELRPRLPRKPIAVGNFIPGRGIVSAPKSPLGDAEIGPRRVNLTGG